MDNFRPHSTRSAMMEIEAREMDEARDVLLRLDLNEQLFLMFFHFVNRTEETKSEILLLMSKNETTETTLILMDEAETVKLNLIMFAQMQQALMFEKLYTTLLKYSAVAMTTN